MVFEPGFLFVGLVETLGFFVEGCAGFGCTVITAPFATNVLGAAEGVPYGTLSALPFLFFLAFRFWKEISWKDLVKILLACIPGMLFGNYLFYIMTDTVAKVGIGAAVTAIALMNIYKHIFRPLVLKKEDVEETEDTLGKKIFRYTCLIVGGIVHGAFNIGGPLISVYTLEAVTDKRKFRNTMGALWAILNTMNAIRQYVNGAITPRCISAVLIGLPFAAVGFAIGVKVLDKINRKQFLRFVYVVLLAVGGNMFISNLLQLI